MVENKKLVPHKHADVIKAFADGKRIEYKDRFDGEWRNICESPLFMVDGEYRVKPEVVKPEWPKSNMSIRDMYKVLSPSAIISIYDCDMLADAVIAQALDTGLVVLPSVASSSAQSINYKKDAEEWGGALNEAAWTFIEDNPEKSALLFNTCKTSLRAAILRYLERVEGSAL